jgi:DNA-binding transcriptional LysR family regulator
MDRLTAMQAFVGVIESGGFTAAARQLPISRAGVSKHVAELESHLGVRLMNRTTRKISLTEAGSAYYQRCKRILEDINDSECQLSGHTSDPSGRLKINVPMSYGINRIGPLLAEFSERYPGISFELTLNDRMVDVVEEGYDLVIRIAKLSDSSLIARKLAVCQFALCASPKYLQGHGEPLEPEDLKQHACLRYQHYSGGNEWLLNDKLNPTAQQYRVKVAGPLNTNNGTIICRAACDGMGIALLPIFIVEKYLVNGSLQTVLDRYEINAVNVYAIYPSNRHLSAKVRYFIDFLVAKLGG